MIKQWIWYFQAAF